MLGKINSLQKSLDEVNMKLGDARVDKHEDARRKKKQEIVETFKSLFPGVVSLNQQSALPLSVSASR
jgi:structural maintenance of chromosome 1